MKKFFKPLLLIVFCLISLNLTACKESTQNDDSLVGTYKLYSITYLWANSAETIVVGTQSAIDSNITADSLILVFKSDGTASLTNNFNNETFNLSWVRNNNLLSMTDNYKSLSGSIDGNTITLNEDSNIYVFKKS